MRSRGGAGSAVRPFLIIPVPGLPPPHRLPPPAACRPSRGGAWAFALGQALLPALLCLPLPALLAPEAAAQTLPTLKVEVADANEGQPITVTLTLSAAATNTITFSLNIADADCGRYPCPQGTTAANENADYVPGSPQVRFLAGDRVKTETFATVDDTVIEGDEVFDIFILNLDAATEATIDPSTPAYRTFFGSYFFFARIKDNDFPPTVTFAKDGDAHRVVTFNPGSNDRQVSLLRLVNAGAADAGVTITGVDHAGAAGDAPVALTVPGGRAVTLAAVELEDGGGGLSGALGDGAGKWRLLVEPDQPITVMSLLSSPTGHLSNLSAAPGLDPPGR